jgi:precorrin isomerase
MATPEEIKELVATSERLVKEANEALERGAQVFADLNIKPGEALEYVRRQGGEAAVQKVMALVEEEMERIKQEAERQFLHAPKARPAGQRPRMRTNMI